MSRLIDLSSRPSWLADLPSEKREALERVVEQHVSALAEGLGAYVMLSTLVDEFWAFAFAITGAVTGQQVETLQEARPASMVGIPHPMSFPCSKADLAEAKAKYPDYWREEDMRMSK